jgi:hypothetical protein
VRHTLFTIGTGVHTGISRVDRGRSGRCAHRYGCRCAHRYLPERSTSIKGSRCAAPDPAAALTRAQKARLYTPFFVSWGCVRVQTVLPFGWEKVWKAGGEQSNQGDSEGHFVYRITKRGKVRLNEGTNT